MKIQEEKKISNIKVLTDTGFVKIDSIIKTKPLSYLEIELENGKKIKCAKKHIIYLVGFRECYAKDLDYTDYVITDTTPSKVKSIKEYKQKINLYDLKLSDKSNHRYFTSGFLSHNSGVGKSLIAGCTVANAQKKDYDVIYFDSEFGSDKEFMNRLGVDTKKLIKIPVGTIEEFKTQCFKIISLYDEKYKDTKKMMIVLDSLGNLASEKELNDATEGKSASDMGRRSQIIRSLFRILSDKIGKLKIPFIVINHTYQNPGNPYISETMSGGEGIVYCSSIILTFTKSKVKDEKKVIGTILKPTTIKNRIVPPFKTGEILLNFETGIDKYYGLLPLAEESKCIIAEGKRYKTIKSDKLYWEKDIYCDEFFEPLLKELNEFSIKANCYSSIIKEEIDKGGEK